MAEGPKCKCQRCLVCGLMWPVVLISIGLLFLLGRLHWEYSFHRLWPVLLIVMGILKVAQAMASTEGHVGS